MCWIRALLLQVLRTAQRKRCEVDLHKRLEFLYGELEPWEPKLIAANKRARLKLRKEQENYCDEPEPKVRWKENVRMAVKFWPFCSGLISL